MWPVWLNPAERAGMTGSPTLLADGADPFARPGQFPSLSCRLYPGEDGRPHPAPSAGQLRAALALLEGSPQASATKSRRARPQRCPADRKPSPGHALHTPASRAAAPSPPHYSP